MKQVSSIFPRINSIRTRLFLLALLLVLFTGGIETLISIRLLLREEHNDALARLTIVVDRRTARIEAWLDELQVALALNVRHGNPSIGELLLPQAVGQPDYFIKSTHVIEDLYETGIRSGLFGGMYVIDPQGQVVLRAGDVAAIPWEAACLQVLQTTPCIQPFRFYPSLERSAVVVTEPILDDQGRLLGVLAAYTDQHAIDRIFAEPAELGLTGGAYLVNADYHVLTTAPESRMLFSPDGEVLLASMNALPTALQPQSDGTAFYRDTRGVAVIGVQHWLSRLQLTLLAEQEQAEAFQSSRRLITEHVALMLLLLGVAALAALYVVHGITAPLSRLSASAARIAAGEPDTLVAVERNDEIGALAENFNRMTGRLLQSRDQLEQRVQERTEELATLNDELRQRNHELALLSRQLVEVQERERHHISRELHDETSQALTSLMLRLSLLERDVCHDEAAVARVAELKLGLNDVLNSLHRLATDLRPPSLDHVGLVHGLRQFIERLSQQSGLLIDVDIIGFDDRRLPSDLEITAYRVVQEALVNVVRHAQATRVDVIVERRRDRIRVIVEDNGNGFDPACVNGERLGLLGMRERARMVHGLLSIDSMPGSGTTILMEAPYDSTDSDRG